MGHRTSSTAAALTALHQPLWLSRPRRAPRAGRVVTRRRARARAAVLRVRGAVAIRRGPGLGGVVGVGAAARAYLPVQQVAVAMVPGGVRAAVLGMRRAGGVRRGPGARTAIRGVAGTGGLVAHCGGRGGPSRR